MRGHWIKKLTIIVIESIICNIVYKFNVETIVSTENKEDFCMFQELNEKAIKGLTIVVMLLCVSYLIFFTKHGFGTILLLEQLTVLTVLLTRQ